MNSFAKLTTEIQKLKDPNRAKNFLRFFKTGKGEYGEEDRFAGLTVPECRKMAKQFNNLSLSDCTKLLDSIIHEERLIGLFILIRQFEKGDESIRKQIYDLYMANLSAVNNWDLVDLSTPKIVSVYLLDKPRDVLYKLAKSNNLWERRIAIMGTFAFILKNKEYKDTFAICELLINDKHDLIHKATGWMLREAGKHIGRDVEETFLKKHYKKMPRTMLRYAIEHFPEEKRQMYLKGKI